VTYRANVEFREQLSALMPRYFNAIAATYHYRKMAERALEDNYQHGRIGIKKIFYVLRPLLACRWIEHARSQPPTEFSSLVAAEWVGAAEREWIAALLEQKAKAVEAQAIELDGDRAGVLRGELARFESLAATLPPPDKPAVTDLDRLMRAWIQS
jgi:predicted nucleotidyltransferase